MNNQNSHNLFIEKIYFKLKFLGCIAWVIAVCIIMLVAITIDMVVETMILEKTSE
jgi:hypothetical protein